MPSAIFSPDRVYRYSLTREWPHEGYEGHRPGPLVVVGLNPSTADEVQDELRAAAKAARGFLRGLAY